MADPIFLPSVIQVYKETGLKHIIVSLTPTEKEEDHYWQSYPVETETALDGFNEKAVS